MTSDPRIERARFVWRFSVLTEGQVALALLVAMLLLAAAAFAYPAIAFTGEPRGADPERVRRLRGGIATTFEEFRPLFGEVTTLTPVGDSYDATEGSISWRTLFGIPVGESRLAALQTYTRWDYQRDAMVWLSFFATEALLAVALVWRLWTAP